MSDPIRWLSYSDLAQALGIGADSARNLVRRKRWARQVGNDGMARIGVPLDALPSEPKGTDGPSGGPLSPPTDGASGAPTNGHINPPTDAPADGALVALEILREHIGRLEAEIVNLKDERDRERVRGNQVEALQAILEIERKRAEELRQERDRWSALAESTQRQLMDQTKRPTPGILKWLTGRT